MSSRQLDDSQTAHEAAASSRLAQRRALWSRRREQGRNRGRSGVFRSVFQLVIGWGFTSCYAVFAGTLSTITLGLCSNWLSPLLLRTWGRAILRIQGVELRIEGREHLSTPAMRVATFNHTSLLDAMIIPVLNPVGGVSLIKQEVLYLPFVGVAVYLMGFLLIDRGRSNRAKRILNRAARRMERNRLTVFIAPEGTRTVNGELQEFKRGAFHLAQVSGAPIVPIVIDGAYALRPKGRAVTAAGVVRVKILPPISTDGLTADTLQRFSDDLRACYVRELAAMAAERDVRKAA